MYDVARRCDMNFVCKNGCVLSSQWAQTPLIKQGRIRSYKAIVFISSSFLKMLARQRAGFLLIKNPEGTSKGYRQSRE